MEDGRVMTKRLVKVSEIVAVYAPSFAYSPFTGEKVSMKGKYEEIIVRVPFTDSTLYARNGTGVHGRGDFEDFDPASERVPTWFAEGGEEGEPYEMIDVPSERTRWNRLPAVMFESAADVLERQQNPVARKLAQRLQLQQDVQAEVESRITLPIEQAMEGLSAKEAKQAKREASEYQRTKEMRGKADAEALRRGFSAGGNKLIDAQRRVFGISGSFAQRQNVQVWEDEANGGKGGYRLIGNKGEDYFPRILKREWRKALEDPDRHAAELDVFRDQLRADGWDEKQIASFFQLDAPSYLTRNDFFGQLEMARKVKLPASFYEHDFDAVMGGFIRGYAQRMGQILAYGQKLKRDQTSKDLFDEAMEEARNQGTVEFLQALQKQVYRIAERSAWGRFTGNVRALASGMLLSNPFTTVPRNMISGALANLELGGTVRTLKALASIVNGTVTNMTALQLGTVKANFLDALEYSDPEMDVAQGIRKFTGTALRISGYNASEGFNRLLATATGMQYATDFLAATPGSAMAREGEAFIRRLGLDPQAIRAEAGDFRQGRESRNFVRRFVKESQFGYDAAQVPLWANGPTGRLFYQFGRWGTQRARTLWKHIFEPAMFGELRNEAGKRYRVRDMKPLAHLLGAVGANTVKVGTIAILTGELFALTAQTLFKRDRDDEDWSVIGEELSRGDEAAMGHLFERLSNDVMVGGMLGILSQPVDLVRGFVQGARFKNPIEPPATAIPKAAYEVLRSWYERGMPGNVADVRAGHGTDLWNAVKSLLPGVSAASQFLGRMGATVAKGTGWFDVAEARQTVSNLRKASRRFAEENGMEGAGGFDGRVAKRPQSAAYDRLQESLLVGDTQGASVALADYMERFGKDDPAKAMRAISSSMRARQPLKVGVHTGEAVKQDFQDWARTHLSPERFAEFERVQETYTSTALALGLFGGGR